MTEVSSLALAVPRNDGDDDDDDGSPHRVPPNDRSSSSSSCSSSERWHRYAVVALITATSLFLYADQNLIGPNMSAIADEFGMSEEEKDLVLDEAKQILDVDDVVDEPIDRRVVAALEAREVEHGDVRVA